MQTTPRIQRLPYGTARKKRCKAVNEMIVQANNDTGACYGVAKCAAVVFEREGEDAGR